VFAFVPPQRDFEKSVTTSKEHWFWDDFDTLLTCIKHEIPFTAA